MPLQYAQVPVPGNLHRVHDVDPAAERPAQHSGQGRVAQQRRILIGYRPCVSNPNGTRVRAGHEGGEAPETLG